MSTLGIVTAIVNPAVEAVVVNALAQSPDDVQVVRRCVEVADVLAVAASGQARAVVLGDNLAGLDADIVARVSAFGVVPIAVSETARDWPPSFDVAVVLDAASGPDQLSAQIVAAARAGVRQPIVSHTPPPVAADEARLGRLVAVWGPAGAPGRSTIALGLADEIARLGPATVLIDADPYGGAQAVLLGMLDESPGIAAACRAASAGTLDTASLARTCLQVAERLRVLTGISRSDRWPELRPSAVEAVLATARALAAVTVVDCGFSIEEDEELTYDTFAPRRNAATTTVLSAADEIVLVSACDPVSVARGVRAAQDLRELIPSAPVRLVVNKVRSGVLRSDPAGQLGDAFDRFARLRIDRLLPWDAKATDRAMLAGRTLADVAPGSPLRLELSKLAAEIAGVPAGARPARRMRAHRR